MNIAYGSQLLNFVCLFYCVEMNLSSSRSHCLYIFIVQNESEER